MKIKLILFVAALIIWLLLNWPVNPESLFIGTLVGLFISLVTSDVFMNQPKSLSNLGRYFWFLYYVPVFAWECFKANIDGAYRVIHPDLPINPGIVRVKTTLKSDTALTFLANSLTLKPGTMTVDIDRENGFLYVHWVSVKSEDIDTATELIVRKFERILKRIFE